jgi:hypothetical protein
MLFKKKRMKISISYGIITGIILSVWLMTWYYFEWYQSSFSYPLIYINYPIQMVWLYWGIRETRIKKYSGEISYPSALLSGLIISLTVALIYSLANYLYFKFAGGDFVSFAISQSIVNIKNPQEVIKESMRIKEMINPASQALDGFLDKLIPGIVFTFIFSMVLRKKSEPVIMKINE